MKDFIKYHFINSIYLYLVLLIWGVFTIICFADNDIRSGIVMAAVGKIMFSINLALDYKKYKQL